MEGERNINVKEEHRLVASYTFLDRGLNLKPRHVL